MNYICTECGKTYPIDWEGYTCECSGLLELQYEKRPIDFERLSACREASLWRYMEALPMEWEEDAWKRTTMGEGCTPCIPLSVTRPNLLIKMDFHNPTLSFKDRGGAMLMAQAARLHTPRVIADSSGNAGTSISAYAARLGIGCDVFVPASTSDSKVTQITAHGAVIHKIPGSRQDTAEAAIRAVKETGFFYASHIFNPFFTEGTKTYVYEIYEQIGSLPDAFLIPVGNGTLVLGAYKAFCDLKEWGYIDKLPRILAVQAENCMPIASAFFYGEDTVTPVAPVPTLAEGIAITAPPRGSQILAAVRATKGDMITVGESAIAEARKELASHGIYVEITSAANYAAYKKYLGLQPEAAEQKIVLPACGAGIKSSH